MNTSTSTQTSHFATLIGGLATAYHGLTPEVAVGLRAVFSGGVSMEETHRIAGLLIDTTPREELQLVVTRLISLATDTEADVMVHWAANGIQGG